MIYLFRTPIIAHNSLTINFCIIETDVGTMLCDCFVFSKCLVNQFLNSVDDLTRIRVIANEYLLYNLWYSEVHWFIEYAQLHEHTQLHEQWTTSLPKHRNYNQIFRQLNFCDMPGHCIVFSWEFPGHHPCNKSLSTHAVARWCPPNFQHINFVRWHPVNSHKKTFARWCLNLRNTFLLYGWYRNSC